MEITLPELGEGLESGEVLTVHVKPGESIEKGQALLEIEAEKATVEVPSPVAGKVTKVMVGKGDLVRVGQVLCAIESANGEAAKFPPSPAAPKSQPESPSIEPREAKQDGRGKAPAPKSDEKPKPESVTIERPRAPDSDKPVLAGPATRRLARQLGIDLRQVTGSAANQRVSEEDVRAFVRQLASGAVPVSGGGGVTVPPLPDFERWGSVERMPLQPIRRRTAQQVALAWSQVVHVTQHDVADITELDAFRKQQDGQGPKLTVTAFALKAAAIALKQFPQFNSSLDLANGQLIVKQYYHIGLAVDTEQGLLVPVVRDVDKKSVVELAQELLDISERARQRKATPDDMRGGTFTITNLGGIGGTAFTPIVNYPEVAILGMSRARLLPVVHDGHIAPRLQLPMSLSYDHRVIDGAAAARFTRRLAELLENPLVMLLHA